MESTTEDDVWAKIRKSEKPDGCWIWTGYISRGYPIISVESRVYQAHRYVYELVTGKTRGRKRTTAACLNPKCVRPDHRIPMKGSGIVRGTPTQRKPKRNRDKLSWTAARAIRKAASKGANQYDLADKYGVTQAAISLVVRGKTWVE